MLVPSWVLPKQDGPQQQVPADFIRYQDARPEQQQDLATTAKQLQDDTTALPDVPVPQVQPTGTQRTSLLPSPALSLAYSTITPTQSSSVWVHQHAFLLSVYFPAQLQLCVEGRAHSSNRQQSPQKGRQFSRRRTPEHSPCPQRHPLVHTPPEPIVTHRGTSVATQSAAEGPVYEFGNISTFREWVKREMAKRDMVETTIVMPMDDTTATPPTHLLVRVGRLTAAFACGPWALGEGRARPSGRPVGRVSGGRGHPADPLLTRRGTGEAIRQTRWSSERRARPSGRPVAHSAIDGRGHPADPSVK
ncbi:unnamed protein product [Vitrella brassicaformis CCMP3155]|uniref:Uncharacterized protein n=1 Tax=Vitrella brassicaformis (strain CCMP3155) TaxID=1169540 RepID=A0A0G4GHK4_VITBC|nr:unnamed protein product [Vitrella brassicaformis CCMP3155]|eukprot:CEM29221.1 unnamed protein product [Vitrella brassicaformis CCMP3155]